MPKTGATYSQRFCAQGHDKDSVGRTSQGSCSQCKREGEKKRRKKITVFLDAYKLGAGCAKCGYRAHSAALTFHHLDPSAKLFNIGHYEGRSMDKIRAEVDKCIVLCANCHLALHHGD